jgi:hypothetical protein
LSHHTTRAATRPRTVAQPETVTRGSAADLLDWAAAAADTLAAALALPEAAATDTDVGEAAETDEVEDTLALVLEEAEAEAEDEAEPETEDEALVDAPLPPAIDMEVTVSVLLSAFWYQSMLHASATVLTSQPLETILGYSAMNTPTVLLLSSCSRMQRPGDLDPVSQPSIVASTPEIVYAGLFPIAQSAESGEGVSTEAPS